MGPLGSRAEYTEDHAETTSAETADGEATIGARGCGVVEMPA